MQGPSEVPKRHARGLALAKQYRWLTPLFLTFTILPTTQTQAAITEGTASYYADHFHGRKTANGNTFDTQDLTAAHRTLSFGTKVLVTNKSNGRSVEVTINDRGPYVHGRMIDLSKSAAKEIGMLGSGTAQVEIQVVDAGDAISRFQPAQSAKAAEELMMDLF